MDTSTLRPHLVWLATILATSVIGCSGGGGHPDLHGGVILTSIAVTPANPVLTPGATVQFTATGTYSDGSTKDLTATASWASWIPAVATVSTAAGSAGLATAVSWASSTTITATVGGILGRTDLYTPFPALESIAITPTDPSVGLGAPRQVQAIGSYADQSTADLSLYATWTSSDPGVATLASGPLAGGTGFGMQVTPLKVGTTTVTATKGTVSGSTTVTVTAATLVSIAVTPASPTVGVGSKQPFTATGTYTDRTTQDLTGSVTWSSSSTAVATISNAPGTSGLATTLTAGTSTITATVGGVTGQTTLTVVNPTLVSLALTPANPTISLFDTVLPLQAIGTYSDGSTQDLTASATWASGDALVAHVSNEPGHQGVVMPIMPGSVTICAIYSQMQACTTVTIVADRASHWTLRMVGNMGSSWARIGYSGAVYVWPGTNFTSADALHWTPDEGLTAWYGGTFTVWDGSKFVLVGNYISGTSTDGVHWTYRPAAMATLMGLTWSGSQFVAYGGSGPPTGGTGGVDQLYTSPDGISWTQRVSAVPGQAIADVIWTGSRFVAFTGYGSVMASTDGAAWTLLASAGPPGAFRAVWSGSRFTVVTMGTNPSGILVQLIYSSTDGISWTAVSPPGWYGQVYFTDIAWSGSRYVAVGGSACYAISGCPYPNRIIATSPDGLAWTETVAAGVPVITSIIWTGSQFVGTTEQGPAVSTDGVNWTMALSTSAPTSRGFLAGVTWAGGKFVAVGMKGAVFDSPDGVAWTERAPGVLEDLQCVAGSGSLYAAGMYNGGILTSPDGISWTVQATGTASSINAITWSGAQWVAVGDSGVILTSPDGSHWTSRASGTTGSLTSILWANNLFVAYGAVLLTSPDGVTWTAPPLPPQSGAPASGGSSSVHYTGNPGGSVAWNGTRFVAVGGLYHLISPDGVTWTRVANPYQGRLFSILWDGHRFVAAANIRGTLSVATSPDGVAWSVASETGYSFNALAWSGSQYVGVGYQSKYILTAATP